MRHYFSGWPLVAGLLILFLLFIGLAWLLWGPARAEMVDPIAGSLWQWYNLFERGLPQADIWALLLILGVARLFLQIVSYARLPTVENPPLPREGRVSYWLSLLAVGGRARRLFIRPFRFLAMEVVAYKEQRPYQETLNRLHSRQLELPAHLQAYLSGERREPAAMSSITTLEPEIEEILQALETYIG
jgi:hypothetical protein